MENIKLIEEINGDAKNLNILRAAFERHGLSLADDGNYLSLDRELESAEAVKIVRDAGLGTAGITMRMEKGQDVVNILHVGSPDPI